MLGDGKVFEFKEIYESINKAVAKRMYDTIHMYATHALVKEEIRQLRRNMPNIREEVQRVRTVKLVAEDIERLGVHLIGFDTPPVDGASVFVFDSVERPAEDWEMKSMLEAYGQYRESADCPYCDKPMKPFPDDTSKHPSLYCFEDDCPAAEHHGGEPCSGCPKFESKTNEFKERYPNPNLSPPRSIPCPKCGASMSEESDTDGHSCPECGYVDESKTNEADEVDRHEAEQTMKPQEEDTEVLPPDHMEDYSPEGEEEKGSKSKGTDNELTEIPDAKLDHDVKYESISIEEGADLYCPHCRENLGKAKEQARLVHCGTCGEKNIRNPEGSTQEACESTGPLFLCNACCKTFRNSSESRCTACESINVDRLVEEINPDKERLADLEDAVDTVLQDKYPDMGVPDVLDAVVSTQGSLTADERAEITRYIESVIDETKIEEAEEELTVGTRFKHEGGVWRVEDVGATQSKVRSETEDETGENIFVENNTILRNRVASVEVNKEAKVAEVVQTDEMDTKIIASYEKARAIGKSREEAVQIAVKDTNVVAPEIRNLLLRRGVDEEKGTVDLVKSMFDVKFTKDGKEEKTKYMAHDEAEVKQEMQKNPKVKVLTVKKIKEGKIREAADPDLWSKLVQSLERESDNRLEAVLNLMSQVWNGGFEQWIDNGYGAREGKEAVELLDEIGTSAAKSMSVLAQKALASEFAANYATLGEEEYDAATQELDGLDTIFYGSLADQLVKDLATHFNIGEPTENFSQAREGSQTDEKLSVGALKSTQAPVLTFDYQTAALPEEIMKDLAQTDYFQRSMVGSRIKLVNARGSVVMFAKDDDQEWHQWSDDYGFLAETRYIVWYKDLNDPTFKLRKFGKHGWVVSDSPSGAKAHVRATLDDEAPGNQFEIMKVELDEAEKRYPSMTPGEMDKPASEVQCPRCRRRTTYNINDDVFGCRDCGAKWDEMTGEVLPDDYAPPIAKDESKLEEARSGIEGAVQGYIVTYQPAIRAGRVLDKETGKSIYKRFRDVQDALLWRLKNSPKISEDDLDALNAGPEEPGSIDSPEDQKRLKNYFEQQGKLVADLLKNKGIKFEDWFTREEVSQAAESEYVDLPEDPELWLDQIEDKPNGQNIIAQMYVEDKGGGIVSPEVVWATLEDEYDIADAEALQDIVREKLINYEIDVAILKSYMQKYPMPGHRPGQMLPGEDYSKEDFAAIEDPMEDEDKKSWESKLKEEDEYTVAGKGIEDEQAAKDLARDKKGQVVVDAEDEKKFQVIVKKDTV